MEAAIEEQRTGEGLSGTNLHKAIGAAAGAAATEATRATYEFGSMGLRGTWMQTYGNMTAMVLLAIGASFAFMWLRADSKDSRDEYRAQVIRQEQLQAEQRREDREDARRREALLEKAIDLANRTSIESAAQTKFAADQMKAAAESMTRIEKAITAKGSIP